MRLKEKMILLCMVTVVFVLSGCFFVILQIQAKSLRDADEKNAENSLAIYCSNIISISSTNVPLDTDIRETTLKSVVAYYFSTYSRLVQTDSIFYSLVCDGDYYYHMSPYDPKSVFQEHPVLEPEEVEEVEKTAKETEESETEPETNLAVHIQRVYDGNDTILTGFCPFQVSNQRFEAYISMNVNETEHKIASLRILCIVLLLFGCILTAVIMVLLVRHILLPIETLTRNAVSISKGDYHLRTDYKKKDEIGLLSAAFDQMSEAIEEKITKQQLLIGALSHEMKTPMTALIGYADSLLRMPLNETQKDECARKIYHAGRLMESLTQKMTILVGMSEEEQIQKTEIDLTSFLEELKELLPNQTDVPIAVHCEVDHLFGDKTLLLSMIINLLENAVRASGDTPQVRIQISQQGRFTNIIVSDKGCGIAKDQIPLITEPFYRVDKARSRKYGGAGLGLALCKRICECHGGTLFIESEPGKGTTVTAAILT